MGRIYSGLIVVLIVCALTVLPACAPAEPPVDINAVFYSTLDTTAKATLEKINAQVASLDAQLTDIETKFNKLEQLAEPALEWIEETKARAKSEHWGGIRTARVPEADLEQLQNDQYHIVKLDLRVGMDAGDYLFESTIMVENVMTREIKPYEELRDDFQIQIDDLERKRQVLMQTWDTVNYAGNDIERQRPTWEVVEINGTTYVISGEGLGWHNGLIRGKWLYHTNSGTAEPSDVAAQALQRLLRGQ